MDVTKQADMNSFYRGLYNQTLGSTTEPKKDTPDTTGETPVIKNEPQKFPASDKKSETKKNRYGWQGKFLFGSSESASLKTYLISIEVHTEQAM